MSSLATIKAIRRRWPPVLVLAALLISTVGFCFIMGMPERTAMFDCPMIMAEEMSVLCPFSGFSQLLAWQKLFTGLVPSFTIMVLAVFLASSLGAAAVVVWRQQYFDRYRHYRRAHPNGLLYNYFRRIFSRGILQPKLCA